MVADFWLGRSFLVTHFLSEVARLTWSTFSISMRRNETFLLLAHF